MSDQDPYKTYPFNNIDPLKLKEFWASWTFKVDPSIHSTGIKIYIFYCETTQELQANCFQHIIIDQDKSAKETFAKEKQWNFGPQFRAKESANFQQEEDTPYPYFVREPVVPRTVKAYSGVNKGKEDNNKRKEPPSSIKNNKNNKAAKTDTAEEDISKNKNKNRSENNIEGPKNNKINKDKEINTKNKSKETDNNTDNTKINKTLLVEANYKRHNFERETTIKSSKSSVKSSATQKTKKSSPVTSPTKNNKEENPKSVQPSGATTAEENNTVTTEKSVEATELPTKETNNLEALLAAVATVTPVKENNHEESVPSPKEQAPAAPARAVVKQEVTTEKVAKSTVTLKYCKKKHKTGNTSENPVVLDDSSSSSDTSSSSSDSDSSTDTEE